MIQYQTSSFQVASKDHETYKRHVAIVYLDGTRFILFRSKDGNIRIYAKGMVRIIFRSATRNGKLLLLEYKKDNPEWYLALRMLICRYLTLEKRYYL